MSKFLNNIEIKTAVESLQDADFSWTENVIEKLNADKNLLPEFSKNPEDFVTNMGIKIPDGYHLHYISKEGIYYPEENNTPSKSGFRIEVRIDKDYSALGVCIFCKGGCKSAEI